MTAEPAERTAPTARGILARVGLYVASLAAAAALYVAHQHFAVNDRSTPSIACLVGAAVLALFPFRAVIGEVFAIESRIMHLAHGLGGLAFIGLSAGGAFSGGHVLTHAALAPFAIMGAAQAVMHQDHPRNAAQAAALRRFATSLPEVEQFTRSGNLSSPENAARAVAVISDLLAKAQALGETELRADPGFQSALRRTTTRFGLTLGLDSIDKAIGALAANPATARAVPRLRRELAKVRQLDDKGARRGPVSAAVQPM
ncbi:MAG: hypothetical protein KGL92_11660 [Gammaproteobacteria bacterium]|nr:hypothetical protein [Gammaproteobacteria bacterium]